MAEWEQEQADDAIGRTLQPIELSAYIAEGTTVNTIIPTPGAPKKVDGAVSLTSENTIGFDYDVANDRFYISQADVVNQRLEFTAAISLSSTVGNTNTTLRIYKKGTLVPGVFVNRKIGVAGDVGAFPLFGVITVSTGDYFEAFVQADNATTITISAWNMRFVEVN
jgi:hypothetical protein